MFSPFLLHIPKSVSLTPSFRAFLTRSTDSLYCAFSHRRPWLELFDSSAFSRPFSLSHATLRTRKNLSYFRINYMTLLSGFLAFSLLFHPLSLVSLVLLLSAWLFLYFFKPPEQPLILFSHTLSDHETLAILVAVTIVVVFFTSIGSLLVSATCVGGLIICIHGVFRNPEDLFLDGRDQLSSTGFFSMANEGIVASTSIAMQNVISVV